MVYAGSVTVLPSGVTVWLRMAVNSASVNLCPRIKLSPLGDSSVASFCSL